MYLLARGESNVTVLGADETAVVTAGDEAILIGMETAPEVIFVWYNVFPVMAWACGTVLFVIVATTELLLWLALLAAELEAEDTWLGRCRIGNVLTVEDVLLDYRSFRYEVVLLQVVLLRSRFATSRFATKSFRYVQPSLALVFGICW